METLRAKALVVEIRALVAAHGSKGWTTIRVVTPLGDRRLAEEAALAVARAEDDVLEVAHVVWAWSCLVPAETTRALWAGLGGASGRGAAKRRGGSDHYRRMAEASAEARQTLAGWTRDEGPTMILWYRDETDLFSVYRAVDSASRREYRLYNHGDQSLGPSKFRTLVEAMASCDRCNGRKA